MGRTIALNSARRTRRWAFFLYAFLCIQPAAGQEVDDATGFCVGDDRANCEALAKGLRRDISRAHNGEYQAIRNVSFCLTDGCHGAIQPNRQLGCAWRLALLASGDPKVDDTDTGFLRSFCANKLADLEKFAAEEQAKTIFRRVYKREMRDVPW